MSRRGVFQAAAAAYRAAMGTPFLSTAFRAELRATLRLAGPLALANMLQMAVLSTDVIFVAQLGQHALAASSLAVALFGIIVWGLQGLTGAVAPLIAAELGRRRHSVREIRRSVRMALWLAMLGGAGGVGVCLAGEPIMLLAGQPPALAVTAGGFIRLLAIAMIPLVIGNVLRIFVAAMGRPNVATAVTAMAVVVNAIGNWALIFGHLGLPALGLQGSAVASIVTSLATLAAYAAAIRRDRRLRRFHLFGHWWRPAWRRLGELVRLGLPIALTVVAEGGLFSGAAFLMGRIGQAELAAHAVALQVAAFFFQVPFGVGQAATIRVGYHFGAGDAGAIGRAGRAALVAGVAFSAVSSAAMLFAPRLIVSAYVAVDAPENAALVGLAVRFLLIAAAFQFFDGLQAIAAGALRGLQDTRVPMIIAIAGYWLGGFATAAGLGLATPLGGLGVWIGLAVGLVLVAALLLRRWGNRGRLRLLPGAGPVKSR